MFEYVKPYKEFAKKLSSYENDRKTFSNCIKDVFENTNWPLNINKFNKDGIDYIDPFTVLCIINGYNPQNRIALINLILKKLNLKKLSFKNDEMFEGVSVLNQNHRIVLNYRNSHKLLEESSNLLWKMFSIVVKDQITNEEEAFLANGIDAMQKATPRAWDRLAHGFSYANPEKYIALSSPNREILLIDDYVAEKLTSFCKTHKIEQIDGTTYLRLNKLLLTENKTNSIPELSNYGYLLDHEFKINSKIYKTNTVVFEKSTNTQIQNLEYKLTHEFSVNLYDKVKNSDQYKARSIRVKKEALLKSNYTCASNCKNEFFTSKSTKKTYVECHHLIPMCYQKDHRFQHINLDTIENIVCLCPQCHRKLHFGIYGEIINELRFLYDKNITNLNKIGIKIDFNEFKKLYFKLMQ